jgi:hypothetical protein
MEKPFYASKTLWTNIVMLVATVSTAFGVDLGLNPEAQIAIVGTVMSVVNIILRFVTKTPITTS